MGVRRRWLVRLVAVLALSMLAFAIVALEDAGEDRGCSRTFDVSAWERPGVAGRLTQARGLVACDTLAGRTRQEVLALLGRPDRSKAGALGYAVDGRAGTLQIRFAGARSADRVTRAGITR